MSKIQKKLHEKQLWGIADGLLNKMSADEYMNYILGFIFYKYLSEKIEKYINEKLLIKATFIFVKIEESSKDWGDSSYAYEGGTSLIDLISTLSHNWIKVPGNSLYGTFDFWVMQYEAK